MLWGDANAPKGGDCIKEMHLLIINDNRNGDLGNEQPAGEFMTLEVKDHPSALLVKSGVNCQVVMRCYFIFIGCTAGHSVQGLWMGENCPRNSHVIYWKCSKLKAQKFMAGNTMPSTRLEITCLLEGSVSPINDFVWGATFFNLRRHFC